jgi:hypothetical protein
MPKTTKKKLAIHAFDAHHCGNMQGSYSNLFQVKRWNLQAKLLENVNQPKLNFIHI